MIKKIEKILKEGGIEEYKTEAKIITKELSGLSFEDILLGKKIQNEDEIMEFIKKRINSKAPLQHLLGYCYFMGEKYIVNKDVLIPRDETEILVNCAFERIQNKNEKIDILDIGIGSGCISCALAKKLKDKNIEILGIDISTNAIKTALDNINKLDLIRKIILRKSDIFSKIRDCEKFDLIVSNPPYIPISQKNELDENVRDFDPPEALFAPDEKGVDFYKKIISDAPKFLKSKGYLAFEIGINQSMLICDILKKDFCNISVKKDLAGIDRVVTAQLKP